MIYSRDKSFFETKRKSFVAYSEAEFLFLIKNIFRSLKEAKLSPKNSELVDLIIVEIIQLNLQPYCVLQGFDSYIIICLISS